jgi:hypothetical protein
MTKNTDPEYVDEESVLPFYGTTYWLFYEDMYSFFAQVHNHNYSIRNYILNRTSLQNVFEC